jgi:DinB superfamily
MQPAEANDIQQPICTLEKSPALFETILRDAPADVLRWKPNPDRWCISEVLAHLADIEQVYGDRVRMIMAENAPSLPKYEQPATFDAGDYSRGTALEHLTRFTAARRQIIVLLKTVPPSSGMRTAQHSELGTITMAQMLNEWASHDLGHLRQIAELYRACAFYPHSGPFQRYSNPRP